MNDDFIKCCIIVAVGVIIFSAINDSGINIIGFLEDFINAISIIG